MRVHVYTCVPFYDIPDNIDNEFEEFVAMRMEYNLRHREESLNLEQQLPTEQEGIVVLEIVGHHLLTQRQSHILHCCISN